MKTRIITGVVSAALFLTVLLLPWSIVLSAVTSLLAAVAVYEVFTVTGIAKHRGMESLSVAFALLAPFFTQLQGRAAIVTLLMYVVLLAMMVIMYAKEVNPKRSTVVYVLATIVTLALSCMSYLRMLPKHGLFYVILSLLMAWMSDTGAYFVGTFFGKHKLCPKLSPKKTVEGLVGGIVISIVISLLAGLIYQSAFLKAGAHISYGGVFLLALVCAPLSVVGDLFASLIKRVCGAKDYGKIFPGHGGVMDRFDSLLFVFPVVYFVATIWPLIK